MDNPTLAVANAFINLFFSINLFITARQRKLLQLYLLSGSFLCLAVGFSFLEFFREFSLSLAAFFFNLLFSLFFFLYFSGLRKFAGIQTWPRRYWVYLALGLSLLVLSATVITSYLIRVLATSIIIILVLCDFHFSTRAAQARFSRLERIMSRTAIFGYSLYILVRFVVVLIQGGKDKFLTDTSTESTITLIFVMVSSGIYAAVATLIDNRRIITILQEHNDYFEQQSLTDQLTGLNNRRYLSKTLDREIERSMRYGHALSIMLLDIDHFKRINDQHGHPKGDRVLRELSGIIMANIRECDFAVRMGGEEFLILLPETGLMQALFLAERLRNSIEFQESPAVCPFTVSLGVSEMIPGETFENWYKRADEALYRAKEQGRNRVEAARPVHIQMPDIVLSGN